MPLIYPSSYSAPSWMISGHIQTIFPRAFRRISDVTYQRERIETSDNDFLDLDWSTTGSKKLAIISHGIDGSSRQDYVRGMVRAFNRSGWSALAFNNRGCSGENNRLLKLYHAGSTVELATVIEHVISKGQFNEIALIGFSAGGNIILKYLGENSKNLSSSIKKAVVFSVPCDLASCAEQISSTKNRLYFYRIKHSFKNKLIPKIRVNADENLLKSVKQFRSTREFDEYVTTRLYGFDSAEDYWQKASSKDVLEHIAIPTLLINAKDDPLLTSACFPTEIARKHPYLHLEITDSGGHMGFVSFDKSGEYWSEKRAIEFVSK